MAKNIWRKYMIGISSIVVIGGAIGLVQKGSSFNQPASTPSNAEPQVSSETNINDLMQDEVATRTPLNKQFEQEEPRKKENNHHFRHERHERHHFDREDQTFDENGRSPGQDDLSYNGNELRNGTNPQIGFPNESNNSASTYRMRSRAS